MTKAGAVHKIRAYGTLVMFTHTIFSLSFGLVSLLLATGGTLLGIWEFFLILVALLAARTGANAINRVIDADIDAANPRTASRQIPMRSMKKGEALAFSIACFVVMVVAAWMINSLCGILSPIALFMMCAYSYTKRFTWLCHIVLGITCGIAPLGAWVAVTGDFGGLTAMFSALGGFDFVSAWESLSYAVAYDYAIFIPIALFVANATWVSGFDTIYATQDFEHDRAHGIHSIPARWGVAGALWISSGLHVVAVMALIVAGALAPSLGLLYFVGIAIIGVLLVYEHLIVKPDNLTRATIASYSVNEIIGIVFMVFSIVDMLVL
jgi:4-hydroxybenzoate polyprenyltransferase